MMRPIAVLTGNRADYSRVHTVLEAFETLQVPYKLLAVGAHLLPRFGTTVDQLIRPPDWRIQAVVEGDSPLTMAKSAGHLTSEIATALAEWNPSAFLAVTDRYETFAGASAACLMNIPIAHIQGGELSGTIDGVLRHAITRLSRWHFPATDASRQRLMAMGVHQEDIYVVGCPATDLLLRAPVWTRDELLAHLKPLARHPLPDHLRPYVLLAYHPVTTEWPPTERDTLELLNAIDDLGLPVVVLWPNIDPGGGALVETLRHALPSMHSWWSVFRHLPNPVFVNLMRHAAVMVGNSSAGIREACYFGTPVVNVGTRQLGREHGVNVLHASGEAVGPALLTQLERIYAEDYRFGHGQAGMAMARTLKGLLEG